MLLSSQLDIAVILNNFFLIQTLLLRVRKYFMAFPVTVCETDALWRFLNKVSFKKL